MENNELHVGINSAADIMSARMTARDLAVNLGFDEPGLNLIAAAISEMASHIANHAKNGEVILTPVLHGDRRTLTVVAHEQGPGLQDRIRTMQFGYSTNELLGASQHGTKPVQTEFDLPTLTDLQREDKALQILSGKILQAREDERRRISRELHDEVGQSLTAISLALAALQLRGVTDPETFSKTMACTQHLLVATMEKVHCFARELRPSLLDELGLMPAVRSHLKNFATCTGLHLKFRADATAEQLDGDQKTVLFRVIQESLTNVAKHADASCVKIFIGRIRDGICLKIADNGKSFNAADGRAANHNQHLGLKGMRERVQSVHGQFVIRPEPGRGTTVLITMPFPAKTQKAEVSNHAKDIDYGKNSSIAGRRPYHRPTRLAPAAGN